MRKAMALFALAALGLAAILVVLPTSYEKAGDRAMRARALILEAMG
jgi:hypothetical protein